MAGLEGLLRGRLLGGRYRIEEVIGRGGMGAVYQAVDERLGRKVAVKVITVAGAADPDSRERLRARFLREARSAAALPHHPNVVPVYDYGTDDELGLDYLVMELLHGSDLATRLQRSGPPPLASGLRILHEAARGVAVGHRAGLIHRDVKPGNIFLAQHHDEVQVRVVDFGIAKLTDDEDTLNALTQDGRIPHSPAYASPEQLRGLGNLTPASDVFSLGAVGYQLLTGQRPFTEADRNKMSLGMPVDVPSLRRHNQAIPPAVDQVVQRALAFDPQSRFPDAMAMAADLAEAIKGLAETPLEPYAARSGVLVPPPGRAEDDDHTVLAPSAEETKLAGDEEDDRTLLAAGPPPRIPSPTPPPTRPTPPPPRRRRSRTPLWVWTLVLVALAAVGFWAWLEVNRDTTLNFPPPPDDTLLVDPEFPEPIEEEEPDAEELNLAGREAFRRGRFEEALALFQDALQLDPQNPEIRQNVGIAYYQTGQLDQAARVLGTAIERDPTLDQAHYYLAQARLAQGDTVSGVAALENFLQATEDATGRNIARQQLQAIRIAQAGGLLGEPVDTARPAPPPAAAPSQPPARRDTTPAQAPPEGAPPPA